VYIEPSAVGVHWVSVRSLDLAENAKGLLVGLTGRKSRITKAELSLVK
jgi:hypothetical protein